MQVLPLGRESQTLLAVACLQGYCKNLCVLARNRMPSAVPVSWPFLMMHVHEIV